MSWGRYFHNVQEYSYPSWRNSNLSDVKKSFLPYGNGRSYGDVCLNSGGVLISTQRWNNFISFDEENGVICCESGVLLKDVLEFAMPKGWFLSVTPGTQFVTVGGAIANDVHGKNHHVAGTFCHFVRKFGLRRSDNDNEIVCSSNENADMFYATIGGLGLTGIITWAEFQLKKISSDKIDQKIAPMKNIDHFLELSESRKSASEYLVSWVDCLGKGSNLGRGKFISGDHVEISPVEFPKRKAERELNIPFEMPFSLINKLSVRAFNYFYLNSRSSEAAQVNYKPFFYPLDKIGGWNKLYGKKGFVQYQCILPMKTAREDLVKLLETISAAGTGSFLTVLKVMGGKRSLGILSFAREGVTFAIDFPDKGEDTKKLFRKLDEIVMRAEGALYPAKDALMSGEMFRASFPDHKKMYEFKDPAIMSDFWKRIEEK